MREILNIMVVQVRDGEMVAVELVARDCKGSIEAVLSLGCVHYDSGAQSCNENKNIH